jgi:uncharacterized membrane protein (UPF0127 family)
VTPPYATPTPYVTATRQAVPDTFIDSDDCRDISYLPLPVTDVTVSNGANNVLVKAEVAWDYLHRTQGLMCRATLGAGAGMLFKYDSRSQASYWMYNVHIPVDILYLDEDGAVVAHATMTPCLRQPGEADPAWSNRCASEARGYATRTPHSAALELPAGWLESAALGGPANPALRVRWSFP